MDPFHERLARVALRAAGQYGFALAGGYAIQAHGFLERLSADVDLFAPSSVEVEAKIAKNASRTYRKLANGVLIKEVPEC